MMVDLDILHHLYVNTITENDKIEKFYSSMKTCRVLINTPSLHKVV